jgi:cytoskeletal protein RodZ
MNEAEQLGAELQAARESRDLTLAAVEQQTRIRAYYLEALEHGDFEVLPSQMQGRGFLRNYARVVGLDPELMAARFDAAIAGGSRRSRGRTPQAAPPIDVDSPYPARPPRTKTEPRRPNPTVGSDTRPPAGAPPASPYGAAPGLGAGPDPATQGYISPYAGGVPPVGRAGARAKGNTRATRRRIPPGTTPGDDRVEARQRRTRNTTLFTITILVISLGALSVLLWYAVQGNAPLITVPGLTLGPTLDETGAAANASAAAALTGGPAIGEQSPTPARPSALPNPSTIEAQAAGTQGTGLAKEVNVQITIKERSQLRIYIDGKADPIYSGSDAPGTVLQYSSKTSVRIECSDGAGIDVSVNGVPQGDLGQRKQKIDKTFTLESLNAPTVAPPPTIQANLPTGQPAPEATPTRVAMTSAVAPAADSPQTSGPANAANPVSAGAANSALPAASSTATTPPTAELPAPTRAPARTATTLPTQTEAPRAATPVPTLSPTSPPPTATATLPAPMPTNTATRTGIFLFPVTVTAETRPN